MCSRTVLNELKNLQSQKKRFRSNFVGASYNASAKLAKSFCLLSPCWFCWMRTEVADNWFAVVDRFVAASSLRMIFVGQTGCRCILLISARGFATSWRNVNILVLLRGWSMFTSHTAYNVLSLYVFPRLHFIVASLLYLLSHETISFGRRRTCISVASSKFLALKFSDSIFGQNNFPCFSLDGYVG